MEAYFDNSATTRCYREVKDIGKNNDRRFRKSFCHASKGVEAENYVKEAAKTRLQNY